MKLLNVDAAFKELFSERSVLTKTQAKQTVNKLKEDLVEATPIDTGLARESWKITEQNNNFNIENTVDYIQYLNEGSSTQAPSHFIETTALQYGKPLGVIVENVDK